LAVLEVGSVARGLFVADALVKRAFVRLLSADPVTPGKYVLVFTGAEADVAEALGAGREAAGAEELDVLYLAAVHEAIVPALSGVKVPVIEGSLGVLEMKTVAATLLAADQALKAADVTLCALRLARGIGGKGYVAFVGSQDAVEASLEAGDGAVLPTARVGRELIARPHPDVDWAMGRL
jgi:microcompartment protein CcmL/EutN